jgi:Mn2+/Fe2+ NRAMP family transporter
MTLSLFAYVAALLAADVDWGAALMGIVLPRITWSSSFFTTLVAILGTTISPYLFFWQASQEAEDQRVNRHDKPLLHAPRQAAKALERIRADTLSGMGIVGTGLLAIPVLAASAAYAIAEACRWPLGLSRKPKDASAFYATLAAATVLGMAITLTPLNPIQALYWSAVINGLVAVPVMIVMMLMTVQPRVMGKFTIAGWLRRLGWTATAAMAACVGIMIVGWFVGW